MLFDFNLPQVKILWWFIKKSICDGNPLNLKVSFFVCFHNINVVAHTVRTSYIPCVSNEVGLSEKKINVKLSHSMATINSCKFVLKILLVTMLPCVSNEVGPSEKGNVKLSHSMATIYSANLFCRYCWHGTIVWCNYSELMVHYTISHISLRHFWLKIYSLCPGIQDIFLCYKSK